MPKRNPFIPALVCTSIICTLFLTSAPTQAQAQPTNRILLRGNLVTPDGVLPNAWLDIDNGRIVHIDRERPNLPNVPTLETTDLIFPGFIDLHNHPSFNIFPRWTPPQKFPNRYAWRDLDAYRAILETPQQELKAHGTSFCDIDEYAEIKALIGGTTSMIGFSGRGAEALPTCIEGLVRNLDVYTGFYGPDQGHERIVNSIGILPRDMNADTAAHIAAGIANGSIDLLAIHIAEGLPTDAESAQELDLLEAHGLLTAHTALIHSVGLSPAQLARVHRAGASIVWSPRSNFELYGATANLAAAYRSGVTISLAPDWSPSGSDNLFDEIRYASRISHDNLNGLFSNRQLVEMASSIPARVARIDDKVGILAPGMLADLFLVHPSGPATGSSTVPAGAGNQVQPTDPYASITNGNINAIDLVMINGVPLYGDPALLHRLSIKTEPLTVCGTNKALNAEALPAGSFAQVESRLKANMKSVGSELAPLAECTP